MSMVLKDATMREGRRRFVPELRSLLAYAGTNAPITNHKASVRSGNNNLARQQDY